METRSRWRRASHSACHSLPFGLVVCATCVQFLTTFGWAAMPQHPFPQHVSYAAGTTRPDHRNAEQLDADVRAYYDAWKTSYLAAESGVPTRYRITFGASDPGRTVSEGQGYGMIITAMMAGHDPDAQVIFDGLWLFALDHPSAIDPRLMAWEVPEQAGAVDSAFDGDADIAYGLLLADAQWGSDGVIDYASAARSVLAGIMASTTGPQSHLPMLGDWVEPAGNTYNQYTTRTSDYMPAHFRTWSRLAGGTAWLDVVSAVQSTVTTLQTSYSSDTGLLPDFVQPTSSLDPTPRPADPSFLEGPQDGDFSYNACRAPWRLGTDALLNGDPTSLAQVRRIADWLAASSAGDPAWIGAGYQLDGTPLSGSAYYSGAFVAPFSVAMMTRPSHQMFLDDLYDAVYQQHEDYYEDTITLLCLLVLTGNYWDPTRVIAPVPAMACGAAILALASLSGAIWFAITRRSHGLGGATKAT